MGEGMGVGVAFGVGLLTVLLPLENPGCEELVVVASFFCFEKNGTVIFPFFIMPTTQKDPAI